MNNETAGHDVRVEGDFALKPLYQLENRAKNYLADEQRKANPDTCLVDLLCDCIRLIKEYENFRPQI